MSNIVIVVFDRSRAYEIVAHGGLSREEANLWLDTQWEELECEQVSPIGKVLVVDRILGVALYAGEKRFAAQDAWAQHYANAVAAVMGRPAVRVDVADRVVG